MTGVDDIGGSNEPLVSVVIPCFNQAHFLGEAIYSVLQQSHKKLELIVVDDGSTDKTREAALWTDWADRVTYHHQENRGLPAARNVGLKLAKGSFVLFLDSDDKLVPDGIASSVQAFRESPVSTAVAGRHREFHGTDGEAIVYADAGTAAPNRLARLHDRLSLLREESKTDVFSGLLQGNFLGMPGSVLYRRELLNAAGGFNETLRACEDYELYLRLARGGSLSLHDEHVGLYRKHGQSMSSNPARMLEWSIQVLRRFRDGLEPPQVHAFTRGVQFWREYYGEVLVDSLLQSNGVPSTARDDYKSLLVLARYAPGLVLKNPKLLTRIIWNRII